MKNTTKEYQDSLPLSYLKKLKSLIQKKLKKRKLKADFFKTLSRERKFYLFAACCVFLIFSLTIGIILFYPRSYIGVVIDEYLTIVDVKEGSPAEKSGLSVGDVILEWGDERFSHFFDLEKQIMRSDIGDGFKLKILKNGDFKDIIVVVEEGPFKPEYLIMAIFFVLLIGFLLIILIGRKFESAVTLLFLISIFLVLFVFLFLFKETTIFRPFFAVLIISSGIAISPLFLHLTYIFSKKRKVTKTLGLLFYLPAAVAAIVSSYFACLYVLEPVKAVMPVKFITFPIFTGVFLLYFGLGIFFLLRTFYLSTSKTVDNQVKWFFLGIAFGTVPLILFFVFLEFVGAAALYYGSYNLFLFISFLFPVSMVFAVTEFHLMDIDALLNRIIVYTLLVFSLVGIYFVLVLMMRDFFGIESPISHTWTALIPVIIVGALYEPLRKRLQGTVDRFLFREKFTHLRAISDYSRNLLSIIDLEILLRTSLDALHKVMGIKRSIISLYDQSKQAFRVKVTHGMSIQREMIFPSLSWVREYLDDSTTVVKLEPNPAERRGDDLQLMLTLKGRDGIVGIMGLSGKEKGELYSSEDLRLLETFSSQLSMAIQNSIMFEESRKAANTREAYGRFLSQALVDKIMSDPEKVKLGGENLEVAVLFCDLRDFTQTTDGMEPHDVVKLLNEYFSALTDVIFSFDGTLDKYIGDGIMALFGAPIPSRDDPMRAVNAAKKMQVKVLEINKRRKEREQVVLELGIGVGLGEVTVGNIGSPRRMEYTAIGDAVNLASRLVDKAGPGEILITSEVNSRITETISTKKVEKKIRVKGKRGQVQVYWVTWRD